MKRAIVVIHFTCEDMGTNTICLPTQLVLQTSVGVWNAVVVAIVVEFFVTHVDGIVESWTVVIRLS